MGPVSRSLARLPLQFVAPALLAVLFLVLHRDLVIGRFVNLDTPIEARSLGDRKRDAELALELLARNPWRGVGAGNYLAAVRAIEPDSRTVHNVALLVAAETGLPGAALWLLLTLLGLWPPSASHRSLGLWLAVFVIGLFDVALWVTMSWRAAITLGLILADVARQTARSEAPSVARP